MLETDGAVRCHGDYLSTVCSPERRERCPADVSPTTAGIRVFSLQVLFFILRGMGGGGGGGAWGVGGGGWRVGGS